MDLAGSGVSVYTTTHAPSAALVGDRLASDFIGLPRDFLATPGVLKLIVHQALLPLLCSECSLGFGDIAGSTSTPPDGAAAWSGWLETLKRIYDADTRALRFRNVEGCAACRQAGGGHLAGYRGRTVVAEYIEPAMDYELLQCIRHGQSLDYLRRAPAGFPGMHRPERIVSILHCASYKALKGQIDVRDVERAFTFLSMQERMQQQPSRTALRALA